MFTVPLSVPGGQLLGFQKYCSASVLQLSQEVDYEVFLSQFFYKKQTHPGSDYYLVLLLHTILQLAVWDSSHLIYTCNVSMLS